MNPSKREMWTGDEGREVRKRGGGWERREREGKKEVINGTF